MNNKKEIISYVGEREIEFCVHFTNVTNLPSILQLGLLPKNTMDDEWIEYNENDSLRLDGYTEAVSISFTSPNYKMFYKYRIQNPSKRWAVLVLDAQSIITMDCAFCFTNAASKRITSIPLPKLKNLQALKQMFAEINELFSRKRMRLENNEPTDPQAEILVFDEIPSLAIKFIIFNDNSVMQQYIPIMEQKNIPYGCDIGYFAPRHDYSFW